MTIRLLLCLAIGIPAAGSIARIGAQGQHTPAVKSGVEAIQIETTVVDAGGRPVADLTSSDFVVRVDGDVRQVAIARYYGKPAAEFARTVEPMPPLTGSNLTAAQGRAIVVVVDVESLVPGQERQMLETASKLIEAIGPSHAVGLLPLPGVGVELTRDRQRVADALKKIVGMSPRRGGWRSLSMEEANAFERHDVRTMNMVIERECRGVDPICARELRDSSRQTLQDASRRTQTVVRSLSSLIGHLQSVDAPKSIVLLSGGLPLSTADLGDYRALETRAAAANTRMYIVQVGQSLSDASSSRPSDLGPFQQKDLVDGLAHIAGVTDGQLFSGVGRATGIFDRIESELLNSYMLAIDARPGDLDGKPHKIDVRVQRPGVTVRARKQLIVTPAAAITRAATNVLSQPVDAIELPLVASAYTTRGQEPDTLRVIFLLESPGTDSDSSGTYALSVLKNDVVAFTTADRRPESGADGILLAAQLAPGRYRLRAALVDGTGRAGSLDMPLSIGLRQAGDLQLSDLLLGPSGTQFTPSAHVRSSTPIAALVEVYSTDPAALDPVAVEFQLRKAGDETVVRTTAGTIAGTPLERRRTAEGQLTLDGLPPGQYAISAIFHRKQQPLGKVTRTFDLRVP